MSDCEICAAGKLTEHTEKINGAMLKWSTCDNCGSEQANSEQMKFNFEEHMKRRSSTGQHMV